METEKSEQFRVVRDEHVAQFYFLIGLMLLRHDDASKMSASRPEEFSSVKFSSFICFLKSSFLSKPNELNDWLKSGQGVNMDVLKLTYRDSAMRYSIIGNWLKSIIDRHYFSDQIEFIDQVKAFSSNKNVTFH
jgi:hypothetical protein